MAFPKRNLFLLVRLSPFDYPFTCRIAAIFPQSEPQQTRQRRAATDGQKQKKRTA
jgi:hypothetical protein